MTRREEKRRAAAALCPFILSLVLMGGTASLAQADILDNPSFSNYAQGWVYENIGFGNNGYVGSGCVGAACVDPNNPGSYIYQIFSVSSAGNYLLSFSYSPDVTEEGTGSPARGPNEVDTYIYGEEAASTQTPAANPPLIQLVDLSNAAFQNYSATVDLTPGNEVLEFTFRQDPGADALGNLSLTEDTGSTVPEPDDWPVLGLVAASAQLY